MDYRYGSHTVYHIEYHFVWVIKYRYKVLTAYSTDVCHPVHGKVGSWPIYVNAEEVSQFEWISEPTLTR
jgi:hypothetical protein